MYRKELENYLVTNGFVAKERNLFSKTYQVFEDQEKTVEVLYKIKGDVVYVIYDYMHKKVKRFKGRLNQLSVNGETLTGLKYI